MSGIKFPVGVAEPRVPAVSEVNLPGRSALPPQLTRVQCEDGIRFPFAVVLPLLIVDLCRVLPSTLQPRWPPLPPGLQRTSTPRLRVTMHPRLRRPPSPPLPPSQRRTRTDFSTHTP
jgi:hypothetical protein